MGSGPLAPGEALVGDLAREDVLEDELRLAGDATTRAATGPAPAPRADPACDREPISVAVRGGGRPGPGQNTRPTTAARCSARFSTGSSRSIRAASTACTVSGIWTSSMSAAARQRSPSSHDHALVDQVPHDLLQEERVALGAFEDPCVHRGRQVRRPPAGTRPAGRDSSAVSGSSATDETFRRPPPHPGRRSVSSGRAGHRNRTGPTTRSASSSRRSSSTGSAQWMSSITATTGGAAASAENSERHAAWVFEPDLARLDRLGTRTSGSSTPTLNASARASPSPGSTRPPS